MSNLSKTDLTIKLKDGRLLGYAEYGAPEGKPVFYFHGFLSSRLDWQFFDADAVATQLNARIITVDRPGMGPSEALGAKDGMLPGLTFTSFVFIISYLNNITKAGNGSARVAQW